MAEQQQLVVTKVSWGAARARNVRWEIARAGAYPICEIEQD